MNRPDILWSRKTGVASGCIGRLGLVMACAVWMTVGMATAADANHDDHDCSGCGTVAEDDHGEHEGHDHADHDDHDDDANDEHDHDADEHKEESVADPHAGHDHCEEAHDGEGLQLTAAQRERFGVVVSQAGPGRLNNEVSLQGEILFNEDRVVHLVPRVTGIALQVHKTLGDHVAAGDVLAVIDSSELASAKLDYVTAITEVGCCKFELPRAQAISDNVTKMLTLLESSPGVDDLREAGLGEMGDYRARLISAYAEFLLTEKAYRREQTLAAKKISSEEDFLAAESAYKKAQADYVGTRDSVAYEVKQALLETARDQQLAELEAETTRQVLHMLGLDDAAIDALDNTATPEGAHAPATGGHVCTDPNCTSCDAGHAGPTITNSLTPPSRLGWYEVRAPFAGVIAEKHITRGERVGEDADIFTIVDMSSVWVNLSVHARDLSSIHRGQDVVLRVDHSGRQARGKIAMVTPFVDEATRSATARVVLPNPDGRWVPGTFATGFISSSQKDLPVVVPREAVQSIDGRDVVFVSGDHGFEMVPVVAGLTDRNYVEIRDGLKAGTPYVSAGAFQLKATVITRNLDPHAGHGH